LAQERLKSLRARQLSSIDDPVEYTRRVLGIEPIGEQAAIMRSVAKNPQTSVVSGQKIGKSFVIACLALWWADTKPRGRVLLTATTANQVRNILWREIRYLRDKAVENGRNLPEYALLPHIGMHWPDHSEIIGFTAKEPEGFQGMSGGNFLICVDEASGFPEDIFAAVFGNMAGGAHLLLTGNPTQPAGTFYDSHHRADDEWVRFQVSTLDLARKYRGSIKGIADPAWCKRMVKQWGVDDPRYKVRLEGKWPDFSEASVIPLYLVEQAQARWIDMETPDERVVVSCDPARFGDDSSIITIRKGKKLLSQRLFKGLDGIKLGREIQAEADKHHRKGLSQPKCIIDVVGIGSSVYDWVSYNTGFEMIPHSGAEQAAEMDKYVNTRTEAWFQFREWLKEGGAIPSDPDLESDLLAPMYDFDQKNRLRLEPKKDIKKRIGRSPDRGDSAVLSTFVPSLPLVFSSRDNSVSYNSSPSPTAYRMGAQRGY
jgi:hypothetical protein